MPDTAEGAEMSIHADTTPSNPAFQEDPSLKTSRLRLNVGDCTEQLQITFFLRLLLGFELNMVLHVQQTTVLNDKYPRLRITTEVTVDTSYMYDIFTSKRHTGTSTSLF